MSGPSLLGLVDLSSASGKQGSCKTLPDSYVRVTLGPLTYFGVTMSLGMTVS